MKVAVVSTPSCDWHFDDETKEFWRVNLDAIRPRPTKRRPYLTWSITSEPLYADLNGQVLSRTDVLRVELPSGRYLMAGFAAVMA